MIKAYKYRIYPTKKQEIEFENNIKACRSIYNWALSERKANRNVARLHGRIADRRKDFYGKVAHKLYFRYDTVGVEDLLLKDGSRQQNLWGANLYPLRDEDERIEYTSLINIRPAQHNRSMDISDQNLRGRIRAIVEQWIEL